MTHHVEEIELTRRLLLALDCARFVLNPSDRPDVNAAIDGRSIGIEATVFHADEGLGPGGSGLRASEEKTAKQAGGRPYAIAGIVDPLPGLTTRIRHKVTIAQEYDRSRFAELWLLIIGQIPKLGAVTSTFALSAALNAASLNHHLHELLSGSPRRRSALRPAPRRAWTRSARGRPPGRCPGTRSGRTADGPAAKAACPWPAASSPGDRTAATSPRTPRVRRPHAGRRGAAAPPSGRSRSPRRTPPGSRAASRAGAAPAA